MAIDPTKIVILDITRQDDNYAMTFFYDDGPERVIIVGAEEVDGKTLSQLQSYLVTRRHTLL